MLARTLCLDLDTSQVYPRIMKCHFSHGTQEWKWIGQVGDLAYLEFNGLQLGLVWTMFLSIYNCFNLKAAPWDDINFHFYFVMK